MQGHKIIGSTVTKFTTTETTIAEGICGWDCDTLVLTVANSGTNMNSCKLYMKSHPDSAYISVISTWSTTASNLNPICTTVLQTLATGSSSYIQVALGRCYAWKLTATTAGAETQTTVTGAQVGYGSDVQNV